MKVLVEPAWLLAALDQRLGMLRLNLTKEFLSSPEAPTVVMTTLTEPPEGLGQAAVDRWERTCDRCGRYCEHEFYSGAGERKLHGVKVLITFGVCAECKPPT